jgi:hypothetical protein
MRSVRPATGALRQFTSLVKGAPPTRAVEWTAVLALANRSLATPALAAVAARASPGAAWPDDVRAFLNDVAARTAARNTRLRAQLVEAVRALNGVGIVPMILKGGMTLLEPGGGRDRLLTDLDLLLRPHQVPAALAALAALDYRIVDAPDDEDRHVAAELTRPQDAGVLDLHRRPPAPIALLDTAHMFRTARTLMWDGARLQVPSPATALLALVWHDQFHDGDYWHGWLDLRHLSDIAALSHSPDMDWDAVAAGPQDRLTRAALASHLLAARDLFGANVPHSLVRGVWPRLQHQRRLLQARAPVLAPLLTGVWLLAEAPAALKRFAGRAQAAGEARIGALERLANLWRQPNPGKI